MTTPLRMLGRTGKQVSALGFGCWAIGGPYFTKGTPQGWGETDDAESLAALGSALDAGVTFFDTADAYGCGHSERLVGQALAGRDDVVVATKFGNVFDEATREASGTDASASYVRAACEASLRRLNRETIDLYQFHWGDYDPVAAEDVVATLEELVTQGKVRSIGWSTDDPARAAVFAKSEHCGGIQQNFSVFGGNADVLALCEEGGLASVVRGPLSMGLLTGRMTPQTRFPDDDVRRGWDLGGSHAGHLEAVDRVRDALTVDGRTLAQGSLSWLLARSDAFLPIPGVRTVAQAEENFNALAFTPLTADQLAAVEEAMGRG